MHRLTSFSYFIPIMGFEVSIWEKMLFYQVSIFSILFYNKYIKNIGGRMEGEITYCENKNIEESESFQEIWNKDRQWNSIKISITIFHLTIFVYKDIRTHPMCLGLQWNSFDTCHI